MVGWHREDGKRNGGGRAGKSLNNLVRTGGMKEAEDGRQDIGLHLHFLLAFVHHDIESFQPLETAILSGLLRSLGPGTDNEKKPGSVKTRFTKGASEHRNRGRGEELMVKRWVQPPRHTDISICKAKFEHECVNCPCVHP